MAEVIRGVIYWIQEATQAGAQGAASPWQGAILSAGVVAAVVSLIGIVIGQYLTGRRHSEDLRQAEQGQITDRFSKAIDQLGSEKLAVRLGGIYALERIANDSPEQDYKTIMEVLTAYVRENASRQPEETPPPSKESDEDNKATAEPEKQEPPKLPADIQASMTVLGRRINAGKENDVALDLRATDLRGADLWTTNLQGATLWRANLQRVNLFTANLQRAYLGEANLQGADLRGANLQGADLREATLITQEQINEAIGDEHTKLPEHLQRPEHWI